MPLIKSPSKKAVGTNIKREEASGKEPKQAIAIALDVQRRAGGKVKPNPNKENKMSKKEEPKKEMKKQTAAGKMAMKEKEMAKGKKK